MIASNDENPNDELTQGRKNGAQITKNDKTETNLRKIVFISIFCFSSHRFDEFVHRATTTSVERMDVCVRKKFLQVQNAILWAVLFK